MLRVILRIVLEAILTLIVRCRAHLELITARCRLVVGTAESALDWVAGVVVYILRRLHEVVRRVLVSVCQHRLSTLVSSAIPWHRLLLILQPDLIPYRIWSCNRGREGVSSPLHSCLRTLSEDAANLKQLILKEELPLDRVYIDITLIVRILAMLSGIGGLVRVVGALGGRSCPQVAVLS